MFGPLFKTCSLLELLIPLRRRPLFELRPLRSSRSLKLHRPTRISEHRRSTCQSLKYAQSRRDVNRQHKLTGFLRSPLSLRSLIPSRSTLRFQVPPRSSTPPSNRHTPAPPYQYSPAARSTRLPSPRKKAQPSHHVHSPLAKYRNRLRKLLPRRCLARLTQAS
jgi:hypothetical protein